MKKPELIFIAGCKLPEIPILIIKMKQPFRKPPFAPFLGVPVNNLSFIPQII